MDHERNFNQLQMYSNQRILSAENKSVKNAYAGNK